MANHGFSPFEDGAIAGLVSDGQLSGKRGANRTNGMARQIMVNPAAPSCFTLP
jgi:hypothetical protein